jgi:hypothetical protein
MAHAAPLRRAGMAKIGFAHFGRLAQFVDECIGFKQKYLRNRRKVTKFPR